jgi:hypothetical protein
MLVYKNLYAFSKKYGYTAKYTDDGWKPSSISYMALLAEKDPKYIELNEIEAMPFCNNIAPVEYFENLHKKLTNSQF